MTNDANRRARFIDEMGIGPVWTLRERQVATDAAGDAAPDVQRSAVPLANEAMTAVRNTAPSAEEIAVMDWEQLQAAVSVCTRCNLCQSRTKAVFGSGAQKAKWLFVGEGPGRSEDLQGEPFVGPAGKLLDNMLRAMGLQRGVTAFIANLVKCRPTDDNGDDRPPTPQEAAACLPYLERQIALIAPRIMVALGKSAAVSLLGAAIDTPVSSLRGTVHRHGDLPLVVTYHPAYLLRKPEDKRKAWQDLCLAMTTETGS